MDDILAALTLPFFLYVIPILFYELGRILFKMIKPSGYVDFLDDLSRSTFYGWYYKPKAIKERILSRDIEYQLYSSKSKRNQFILAIFSALVAIILLSID